MTRLLVFLFLLTTSCGAESNVSSSLAEDPVKVSTLPTIQGTFKPTNYTELALDPGNDSLWYHLVLDIPGDKMLAIAQPINENRRGIRMQLLTMSSDSIFTCHAESSPGYDSSKLFPTFHADDQGNVIILADTGERDSWGVKVYLLENDTFHDLGFIDAGTVHYLNNSESEKKELNPLNIASHVQIVTSKKGLEFRFDLDEMVLFDDGKDNLNTIVNARKCHYVLNRAGQWKLRPR